MYKPLLVLINGKSSNKFNVVDRLVQFGDGIFETCLVLDKYLLFWSEHFARLEKGRLRLLINAVGGDLWLEDIVKALAITGVYNCVVKLILSRGSSMRGYGFDKNITPNRIVIISQIPQKIPKYYALTICTSGYSSNKLLAGIKHCNRLEQILARANMSADECVMLDRIGNVISVTQANIFVVKNNTLLTPDLSECGIAGTRRDIVLNLASSIGLITKVGVLTVANMLNSQEIFISNSVIGVREVTKINGHFFNENIVTNKVINAFTSLQKTKTLSSHVLV